MSENWQEISREEFEQALIAISRAYPRARVTIASRPGPNATDNFMDLTAHIESTEEDNPQTRDRLVAMFSMQPMPEGADWSGPPESQPSVGGDAPSRVFPKNSPLLPP